MTHLYTVLHRGTVLCSGEVPASAICWAADIVLAIGTDAEVSAITRGDSEFCDLRGAFVIPLAADAEPRWPVEATLEVGGPADLAILDGDPRQAPLSVRAIVRGGRLVAGAFP